MDYHPEFDNSAIPASARAAEYTYEYHWSKDKKRIWLIPENSHPADSIHVTGGTFVVIPKDEPAEHYERPYSDGYGGATLTFHCQDDTVITAQGAWNSNADDLFLETGVDIRDKYLLTVVIGRDKFSTNEMYPPVKDVVFIRENFVGRFNVGVQIAQCIANELNMSVYLMEKSDGGGMTCFVDPKPIK